MTYAMACTVSACRYHTWLGIEGGLLVSSPLLRCWLLTVLRRWMLRLASKLLLLRWGAELRLCILGSSAVLPVRRRAVLRLGQQLVAALLLMLVLVLRRLAPGCRQRCRGLVVLLLLVVMVLVLVLMPVLVVLVLVASLHRKTCWTHGQSCTCMGSGSYMYAR